MDLWKKCLLAGMLLTAGSGCVEFWGKEGIVQEAVERDTKENLPKPTCSDGRAPQMICTEGKPDQCHLECPK